MGHKCYISFKTEDSWYKKEIQKWSDNEKVDMIDKSLNTPISSENEDYIMRKIREDYLSDSTVTIFLIGLHSAETLGWEEQRFIKRELQASLYNGRKAKSLVKYGLEEIATILLRPACTPKFDVFKFLSCT